MKCYYEILSVNRDANADEIKSAYKKLALRWHPDKNIDNAQEAKNQFQLLQQAYEVLSDSHERAWYDNHREQILRGKDSKYEDNSLNVFEYFSASCFKGYDDEPTGFYQIYSDVFEKIGAEDIEFFENEEDVPYIPKFGNSKSNYEEIVAPFYAYWQSYFTKRSYSWLCPYNIQEIKDRKVLREIEKDMRKIVQKARKERNEEVRNLVSFVRKRDKRVQVYRKCLENRAAENRKKQTQVSIEKFRKRNLEIKEQAQSQEYVPDGYEERLRELELEYSESDCESSCDGYSSISNETFENIGPDNLYCVACNKSFKNQNAFENHEASKKHSENEDKLIKQMRQEENDKCFEKTNTIQIVSEDNISGKLQESVKDKTKKMKKSNQRKNLQYEVEEATSEEFLLKVSESEDDSWENNRKQMKKGKKLSNRKNIGSKPIAQGTPVVKLVEELDVKHMCVTCKNTFSSKNKLFSHLKCTNHGVYIAKSTQSEHDVRQEKTKRKCKTRNE